MCAWKFHTETASSVPPRCTRSWWLRLPENREATLNLQDLHWQKLRAKFYSGNAVAERAPERGAPAEGDRLNRNKDVTRTASFTASNGSPSSSCSSHTSSNSRCWMPRRDYKENANGVHGDSLRFMRKLKAYQIKTNQLGTMPSPARMKRDGREDLATWMETLGGQRELARRMDMRVRVDSVEEG